MATMNIVLILFLSLSSPAQELFQQANSAYEAGRYDEAVMFYDSTLKFINSAEVYYNRGNAHFKANHIGYAIADYLRAWSLKPQDKDILFNLNYARQFRVDKNPTPQNFLTTFFCNLFTIFNPSLTRLLAALLFFISAALGAGYFLFRKPAVLTLSLIFLLLLAWAIGATLYLRGAIAPNSAVVIVPEAILFAGPGEEYKQIVAVHDGLEVKIVEQRPGWVLIQIPGGLGGWVQKEKIELVFAKQ